ARLLEKADVIFWIGPAMEASLVKPLSIISEKSRVVAMAPNEADPHIWLDPENVITMIDDITAQLNIADPYNEDRYTQNAVRMKERIEALNIDLRQRLTTVSHKSIIVYHDAYNHFAKSFGLNIAGTFAPTPDQRPGAARISAIRQMMASGGVHCLFKEPQFDAAILTTAIEGIDGARIADLDPIGTGLTPDKDLYFNLMKSNVEAIRSCLSETP
ncbi:MAG: zinc ABC transporter solute-binding protein, partial [Rhodospirillaceae bacterium]|nr:zinc ABC transporter solute-binding protein [Rhodospirillaceae bacterium]